MNLDNDKEFQKKLQKGYERLALVSSLWALISSPLLFILIQPTGSFKLDNDKYFLVVLVYLIWCIIGILLSPKIVNKIWK
jgi:hypothetical protein